MKRFKKKEFWEMGSGEIIGFLYTLPILLTLMVMLIGIIQVGALKERLEYTAYVGCRAAVVAKDFQTAEKNAEETVRHDLESSSLQYDPDSLEVSLRLIETGKGTKNQKNTWTKGNYVECLVKVNVKTVTPLIAGMKTTKIVMMIERPVDAVNWFEGSDAE